MACDAGSTLNRNLLVGLHPLHEVHGRQVLNACWPAPAIITWTFKIVVHEEDQYTVIFRQYYADYLFIALKQTEARPLSSGTPINVLFSIVENNYHNHGAI